jgi:hypothetical protein
MVFTNSRYAPTFPVNTISRKARLVMELCSFTRPAHPPRQHSQPSRPAHDYKAGRQSSRSFYNKATATPARLGAHNKLRNVLRNVTSVHTQDNSSARSQDKKGVITQDMDVKGATMCKHPPLFTQGISSTATFDKRAVQTDTHLSKHPRPHTQRTSSIAMFGEEAMNINRPHLAAAVDATAAAAAAAATAAAAVRCDIKYKQQW